MSEWVCLVVRHASAGDRDKWEGLDELRPLDDKGRRQAAALVPVVTTFDIQRLVSADVLRCVQTLEPSAEASQLPIEQDHLLSEDGYWENPSAGLARFLSIAESGVATAISSQGGLIPDVLARALLVWGHTFADNLDTRKGAYWVLHLTDGPHSLVEIEKHPSPK